MSTPLPEFLYKFDVSSPQAQREPWVLNAQWKGFLANHSHVVNNLESEINEHGGIRRSFLMTLADGDVEDFFLSVMAWAGGKRKVLPHIKPFLPHDFKRYFEPFIGIIST